jgi:4-hydroxy-tetrahydrodipicolinate reductase
MGIRVGVFGAGGRMGRTVCEAVENDDALELVAGVDPFAPGPGVSADRQAMLDAGVAVAVDFTVVDAARENVEWCAANSVHAVVGTTGFTATDLERFRGLFTTSNCLVAPNFAIGAVLMMRFAELAAPWFDTVEVIELHHDGKVDAPSGTAMATVERIAAASSDWSPDPTQKEVVAGSRGGAATAGIRVHSVRMRGMVAHQEVLFGTTGQTLSIRHDTVDRDSFMPGVLLAVKHIADHPGLTVGLDALLFA